MNWWNRFHWKVYLFAWRVKFAGRLIEKTRCTLSVGLRRADEALYVNPEYVKFSPVKAADERIKLFGWKP